MGKIYSLSPTGKLAALIVGCIAAAFIAGAVLSFLNAHTYYTCKQLKAEGHAFIKKGDGLYQPALDRDHDGIACE